MIEQLSIHIQSLIANPYVQLSLAVATIIGGWAAVDYFREKTKAIKQQSIISPKSENTTSIIRDTSRLPEPTTELIGRTEELQQIQQAFDNPQSFLAIIVAAGGIGKSALTDAWLKSIQPDYRGVERVFAWSFYSQGSHDTQTSSAPFFEAVLPFFGWIGALPKDDVEKGRALARLLSQQTFILILDGLEPLQHPTHILDGELKDNGIKALLNAMRREGLAQSPSLILISSRQHLQELERWETAKYISMDLQTLPKEDGAKLLKKLEVKGTEQELQQATIDMGGHALALVLLGKLLKDKFNGHIERRDQLPDLWLENRQGAHAQRVLQFYHNLWQRSFWQRLWRGQSTEQAFLYLLSLFDRPMGICEKEELVAKAECAKPLRQLDDIGWEKLEDRLQAAGILLPKTHEWDCHPLIRDYFARQFKTTDPALFQQAHLVLFKYYQQVPKQEQLDTLKELEPLYRAVVHGCLAGKYQTALVDVYRDRILRGREYYSQNNLGAYSQDLTALSTFFLQDWSQPVQQNLSEADQAWLLAAASFCLMSLGRLTEAIEPRQSHLKLSVKAEKWKDASKAARNLVFLLLPLGRLEEAAETAKQAIDYADKSESLFARTGSYACLATVLHRQGQAADAAFEKAEQLQQQHDPSSPQLHSLRGFWYCAWLLDQPNTNIQQMIERGEYSLKISLEENWLFEISLAQLTLAQAYSKLGNSEQATTYFEQAVLGIRKAGKTQYLPEFLIDRANFYLDQQQIELAQQDLDEAWQIIERGKMKLYEVDYHLAMYRYNHLPYHLQQARELIQVTGYHLRDKCV